MLSGTEKNLTTRSESMKSNDNHLQLFVYGTLKRGFWNHDRLCTRAISIETATTWGRLYHLPAGFPALQVPKYKILAYGTLDPVADSRTQNTIKLKANSMACPQGDWDLIHGELMTFKKPGVDLPPIDRLKGLNLKGCSMYKRVLVTVKTRDLIRPVWLYHYVLGNYRERIASNCWT